MKNIFRNSISLLTAMLMCLSQGCTKSGRIVLESGTSNRRLGLWFNNANTGTVAGDRWTILRTTDRVDTSIGLASVTEENLWGVSFSGSLNGWAVGTKGTILRTTIDCEP